MSIWLASWSDRVIRSGCWYIDPQFVRVAYRNSDLPGFRSSYLSFRLMRRAP